VPPVIEVKGLDFRYPAQPADARKALDSLSFRLEAGTRTILVGRNGAGKSTLLHILAGKHMVPEEKVLVLGRPAFHDTTLAADVQFLGGRFQFDVDVVVADIIRRTPNLEPARRDRLLAVLGVNPGWHMHRISDGQRRRVQIFLGLLRPAKVLLLDEVTTDLDLLARIDLLQLLREETEQRGATIVYATHILDALEDWATHIAFIEGGRLLSLDRLDEVAALKDLRARRASTPLYRLCESWLRNPPEPQ
jgi:CCR4-NOT complex subunit CAF16